MSKNAQTIGWWALILAGTALPFCVSNDYYLTVMGTAYIFAVATLGLNLITGYTGQYNLAHSGFMAIGAYTVGILTVDYNVGFWKAFVLSGIVTAIVGYFVGLVSLRLKGHFFSIFTLCVGFIIFLLIEKSDGLTHGTVGIIGIPNPTAIGPLAFETVTQKYFLVFAFLVLGTWVMRRIVGSLLGHTFMAIRNGEELAESLGIHLRRNKVLAFVISVAYAGYAGGLYAGFIRFLGPDLAGVESTFNMTMYMLVGGLGTVFGPLLGALAMPWLAQYLQFLQEYRYLIFGPVLVLLVIFMPNGVVGSYMAWRARQKSHSASAAAAQRKRPVGMVANEGAGNA